MKLWTLMENTTCDANLVCEHGLSLYIEANGQRILFDAGQTGAFADNAQNMGVDLSQVDLCILSHGHYDHGGGIKRFLEVNDHAKVYVSVFSGTDERKAATFNAIKNAAGFVRRELGAAMHIRTVPELQFITDNSLDYGERIDKLLSTLTYGEHNDDN